MEGRAFRLVSVYDTTNVLTVKDNDPHPMAWVQVWNNLMDLSSAWFIDSEGYIHNQAASELCLSTVGENLQSQDDIYRYVKLVPKVNAETWQISKYGDGTWTVTSKESGLHLACWGSTEGVVAQSSSTANPMLRWVVQNL